MNAPRAPGPGCGSPTIHAHYSHSQTRRWQLHLRVYSCGRVQKRAPTAFRASVLYGTRPTAPSFVPKPDYAAPQASGARRLVRFASLSTVAARACWYCFSFRGFDSPVLRMARVVFVERGMWGHASAISHQTPSTRVSSHKVGTPVEFAKIRTGRRAREDEGRGTWPCEPVRAFIRSCTLR